MRQILLVCLWLSIATPPAMAADDPPSIGVYAALPQADDLHLSPDGRAVAMITSREQRSAVRVWRPDGPENWFIPSGNEQLNWIAWKGNGRLLLSLRFTRFEGGRAIGATRLMSTDLESRESVQVTFREPPPPANTIVIGRQSYQPPNLQDRVISALPQDPRNILLAAASNDDIAHPAVMQVDITSGRPSLLLRPTGHVVKWLADPDGVVRLRMSLDPGDGYDNVLTIRVRDGEADEWRVIHRSVADRDGRFIPLAFARDNASILFVLADQDNGRLALRPFDTIHARFGPVLAADAACDIEPLLRDNRLIGYVNPCQGPTESYLDPAWQQDQEQIGRALKPAIVAVIDRSADGRFALLRSVLQASAPPTYWYFDRGKKTLTRIADAYGALPADQIGVSRRVILPARDGLAIPALLTLPPGHASQPIGFVVLPHGGPIAHDSEDFDWIVQFIASRGFGVIQPQYRGSSGFGAAFQRAGYRQWGGRMQDDVTDATRWLIAQKLADPKRICIAGFSYGGYAALMGAATQPELYQCAIAAAAVTDLEQLLNDRDREEFGGINRDRTVGPDGVLSGQSPIDWAAKFTVPVLLIHGRQDFTVPISHAEAMETRLRQSGHKVATLYLDQADHFLSRPPDRLACLRAIDGFLTAQLGSDLSLPPS